jgi:hypothetical protein
VIPVSALRAELVRAGDLREEVGFQNDVNGLLASLEDPMARAWSVAALPMFSPDRRRKRRTTTVTTVRVPTFVAERDDPGSVPIALMP